VPVPVIFFFIGVVICVAFREFHRTLSVLRSDFMSFQVAAAECFCCCHDHVDPTTGQEMICDRKVIEGCIEEWWDELEPFEEFVQTRLLGRVPTLTPTIFEWSPWPSLDQEQICNGGL